MLRIQPSCSVCGSITATVKLTREEAGWRLDGKIITDERAALVTAAAELPYNEDRFWHAGLEKWLVSERPFVAWISPDRIESNKPTSMLCIR